MKRLFCGFFSRLLYNPRMGDLLTSECPHCSQPVEYPSQGAGQTIPCPTCEEPFVLAPSHPPAPKVSSSTQSASKSQSQSAPMATARQMPPTSVAPLQPTSQPRPKKPAPLDEVCDEFANDPAFTAHVPTRDQIARAWAWARFQNSEGSKLPTHLEIVAALKKLFPAFKEPRQGSGHARPGKHA